LREIQKILSALKSAVKTGQKVKEVSSLDGLQKEALPNCAHCGCAMCNSVWNEHLDIADLEHLDQV
jgi:hypothetical protein